MIEDLPIIRDVAVRLRLSETVKSLRLEPAGQDLGWEASGDGSINLIVPEFSCHCAVVAGY